MAQKIKIWQHKKFKLLNYGVREDLESPLDCKQIQPVHPKGNQSWIFFGRTDAEAETTIFWPPDAKNWLIRKDPVAGKDSMWEEKRTTEDEMVGWHHWLNGHTAAAAAATKLLQSCPTLCNSIVGSPPGSPVPGIPRQEHWSGLPLPSPMHETEKWKWSRSVISNS